MENIRSSLFIPVDLFLILKEEYGTDNSRDLANKHHTVFLTERIIMFDEEFTVIVKNYHERIFGELTYYSEFRITSSITLEKYKSASTDEPSAWNGHFYELKAFGSYSLSPEKSLQELSAKVTCTRIASMHPQQVRFKVCAHLDNIFSRFVDSDVYRNTTLLVPEVPV
jgi:hypothetical protein